MQVNTLIYLAFFAAAALLNYALPRVARPYFLLAASYLFYGWSPANRALLPVLLGATVVTWAAGLAIGKSRNRLVRAFFLLLAVGGGVGLLFFYKYITLFRDIPDLVTPLGLSYFTFAALSYSIDVYKKRCRVESNLLHYALFVSFFPTMFTGPIERYPHFRPQIQKSRRFSYNRCAGGAFRMLWGYTKKMVLADNLAQYVSMVYREADTMGGPNLLAATLLFSVYLYMDFSGSCDIALGAARILGYDLIENFQTPFGSTTFQELWTRWHVSMNGWFRDYIYFPLGGSRCSLPRQLFNLMAVFTISGLWHGADLRFLLWGVSCGAVVVLSKLTAAPRAFLSRCNPLYRAAWFRVFFRRCIVFLLFSFTMVFFACALYDQDPLVIYGGIPQGWQGLSAAFASISSTVYNVGLDGRMPVVLTVGTALVFAAEAGRRNVARWIRKQNFVLRWVLYYACGAAILFFAAFGQSAFIYQQM